MNQSKIKKNDKVILTKIDEVSSELIKKNTNLTTDIFSKYSPDEALCRALKIITENIEDKNSKKKKKPKKKN